MDGGQVELHYQEAVFQIQKVRYSAAAAAAKSF